ncbi:MAG: hypothetical protein LC808_29035, partial [Actinobacteria bacterium]|nr:hypothetical protein [Actinomycetota bacterium]
NYGFTRSTATSGYTENTCIDINGAGIGRTTDFVVRGAGSGTRLFRINPGDSKDINFIHVRNVQRVLIDNLRIDNQYATTKALQTLSFTATPSDGQTVTVGNNVYTFRTSDLSAANAVLIGGSNAATRDNFLGAVQASTSGGQGPGVTYGTDTTAHTQVTAVVGATGTSTDFTSINNCVKFDTTLDPPEWVADGLGIAATGTATGVAYTGVGGGGFDGDNFVDSQPEQSHCIKVGDSGNTGTGVRSVTLTNLWLTNCRGDGLNLAGNNTPRDELTISANPANNETVILATGTANEKIYRFVTALVQANDVLIGAKSGASRDNLKNAINGGLGSGSTYHSGTTPHASMSASNSAGSNLVVNSSLENEPVAETLANGSWTTPTLVNVPSTTDEVIVGNCHIFDTFRTCLGVQRGIRKVVINGCVMRTGRRGCLDFEPTGQKVINDYYNKGGSPQQFVITNNILERTTANATVATLLGGDIQDRNDYSVFNNNLCLGGGVAFLGTGPCNVQGNVFIGNNLPNRSGLPDGSALFHCRRSQDLVVTGNYFEQPATADSATRNVVQIFEDSTQQTKRVRISNNQMRQFQNAAIVNIEGAEDLNITDNDLYYYGAWPVHLVQVLSASGACRRVEVSRNHLRGFLGSTRANTGIRFNPTTNPMQDVVVNDNVIDGVTDGIRFGGDTTFSGTPYTRDNVVTDVTGTALHFSGLAVDVLQVGGTKGGIGEFLCTGTPEGLVTAPVGSRAYRTDGGAGTTFYVKETGTGNTGWAAK